MRVTIPSAKPAAGAFSRATVAAYIDDGVLRTADINQPRYEAGAILLEDDASNLVAYSEQFNQSAWTKSAASVTANAVAAPDGNTTADKLIESATTATHLLYVSYTPMTRDYTLSVFAKAGERSVLWLGLGFTGGGRHGFNLATGALLSGTISSSQASIRAIGGGWYRCSITVVATTGAAGQVQIGLDADTDVAGSVSYAGDGSSGLYIWGAQLEIGAAPTSYIQTLAGTGSRSADVYTGSYLVSQDASDIVGLPIEQLAEDASPLWSAATAYSVGDIAHRLTTHRVYRRLVAGTTAATPESDPTNWRDMRPTTKWAALSLTEDQATASVGDLIITLTPPAYVSSLSLQGISAASATVVVTSSAGAVLQSSAATFTPTSVPLSTSAESSWLVPISYQAGCRISITLKATGSGLLAGARLRFLCLGVSHDLGGTLQGPRLGITDYSRKDIDEEFGMTTLVRRGYSKRLALDVLFPNTDLQRIARLLSDLRAIPAVWVASEVGDLAPLSAYGWVKDWGVTVSYARHSLCSIEIEGLL